ncbi:hypothetical protein FNV43_RR19903 [Rhamnella rubrinervis]|uniref:Uncharacterized protein n=1 Tax=Rhamnella rubrinervis TaxID=2594499 RepID=A0A8K0DTW3_9ROSA|nr:hypothetical protein FNV43_RR19903 [Rhamnella rubrinervis]
MAVKLGMVMKLAVLALLLVAVSAIASSVDLFDLLPANKPEGFNWEPSAARAVRDVTAHAAYHNSVGVLMLKRIEKHHAK